VFFLTWGVMLTTATVVLAGYSACKERGQAVSVFYLVYPLLLMMVFLLLVYFRI
jgi:hypothetical protein